MTADELLKRGDRRGDRDGRGRRARARERRSSCFSARNAASSATAKRRLQLARVHAARDVARLVPARVGLVRWSHAVGQPVPRELGVVGVAVVSGGTCCRRAARAAALALRFGCRSILAGACRRDPDAHHVERDGEPTRRAGPASEIAAHAAAASRGAPREPCRRLGFLAPVRWRRARPGLARSELRAQERSTLQTALSLRRGAVHARRRRWARSDLTET